MTNHPNRGKRTDSASGSFLGGVSAEYRRLLDERDRDMRIARIIKAQGYGVVSPCAMVNCARMAHYAAMSLRRRGLA